MKKGRLLSIAGIVCALGGFVAYSVLPQEPAASTIGMVQRIRLRVSPEVTGRLVKVLVAPGDSVLAGDTLAVLDNPELSASIEEARAAVTSAAAERDRIRSGVRQEEVAIAARAVETAEANLLLARQMYDRAAALVGRGTTSRQRLDETTAQLEKAQADLDSRKAEHAAATAGPTAEERALAEAKVAVAITSLRDVEARVAKLRLVAPQDATVGTISSETGEILPAGRTVVTLDLNADLFFAFSIREDRLNGVGMGSRRELVDDSGKTIPAHVTEMRPLGEFATWRAARAVGDHDLNSFRVRFEPLEPTTGLAPGMAVWLPSPN